MKIERIRIKATRAGWVVSIQAYASDGRLRWFYGYGATSAEARDNALAAVQDA